MNPEDAKLPSPNRENQNNDLSALSSPNASLRFDYLARYRTLEKALIARDLQCYGEIREKIQDIKGEIFRFFKQIVEEVGEQSPFTPKDPRVARALILLGDVLREDFDRSIASRGERYVKRGLKAFEELATPQELLTFALQRANFFEKSLQPQRAINCLEWGLKCLKEQATVNPETVINLHLALARLRSKDLDKFEDVDKHLSEVVDLTAAIDDDDRTMTIDLAKTLLEGAKIGYNLLNFRAAGELLNITDRICSKELAAQGQSNESLTKQKDSARIYLQILKLKLDNFERDFQLRKLEVALTLDLDPRREIAKHNSYYCELAKKAYKLAKEYGLKEETQEVALMAYRHFGPQLPKFFRRTIEQLSSNFTQPSFDIMSPEATNILLDSLIKYQNGYHPSHFKQAAAELHSRDNVSQKDLCNFQLLTVINFAEINDAPSCVRALERLLYKQQEVSVLPPFDLTQCFHLYGALWRHHHLSKDPTCFRYVLETGEKILGLLNYREVPGMSTAIKSLTKDLRDMKQQSRRQT